MTKSAYRVKSRAVMDYTERAWRGYFGNANVRRKGQRFWITAPDGVVNKLVFEHGATEVCYLKLLTGRDGKPECCSAVGLERFDVEYVQTRITAEGWGHIIQHVLARKLGKHPKPAWVVEFDHQECMVDSESVLGHICMSWLPWDHKYTGMEEFKEALPPFYLYLYWVHGSPRAWMPTTVLGEVDPEEFWARMDELRRQETALQLERKLRMDRLVWYVEKSGYEKIEVAATMDYVSFERQGVKGLISFSDTGRVIVRAHGDLKGEMLARVGEFARLDADLERGVHLREYAEFRKALENGTLGADGWPGVMTELQLV